MDNTNDFIKDWLEGKVSPAELEARKKKGDTVVHDFEELITRSSQLQVPGKITQEDSWKKLAGKLSDTPKPQARVVTMNRWLPISIAASVTLFVVAFFFASKTTVATGVAETKVQLLPDGSEVTLNATSEITFPRFAWMGGRNVTLTGEAFFNVKKGQTFTVETTQGTVAVLGTEFNVRARPSAFEVSCFTGKVKVASDVKEIVLTPGTQTKLGVAGLTDATSFEIKRTTWRDGDFYFEGQPLSVVIDELERQFGFDIEFSGDVTRLYSGYFSNKDANEALEMVFKPMSLQYQREANNKVIVR